MSQQPQQEISVINLDQLVSMTSVEIAELTGKRHDNVIRDVRKMLEELNGLSFEGVDEETYKDAKGESRTMYRLDRKHTFILVAGYSVQLRAKCYDYIQTLERRVLQLQAQQLQVAQTKAICYAPGAIVLDSKLDSKSGATPTEVIKALDLKLTNSKMLTASVLTGYLKALCRPNPFYTKRVTESGITDIDLSTGRPRAIFNKKGEINGYYRLQPQPNGKEPTIKILRKGYDWLKDNWKDIAHDMRTSNIKVVRRLVDSHLNSKATKSQKVAAGKGADYGF
ncbi:Rha family transcriptional regulator [Escherichia coli]|nr:hypothetical protein [Escherichia coli]EFM0043871.1 Rha family transcriptional regulator [Escherichia coli]EGV9163788.1 hypothetical protein [Escherichia coli]EKP6540854.1 Rha family transcriptional regulator [Escherichia coli]